MVKKIIAKIFVYLILLLMYLPIFVLIVFSFTDSDSIGVWNGFTFQLYIDLFKDAELMGAFGNTLLIAFVSAIVSTLLGTLGAIGTYYSSKKAKKAIETITQLPVVNAEIVMALSLAVLFFAIDKSFFTLVVGHVVLTVAFVYLSVKPKLQQMDPNIYEAALDLGATPKVALYRVILPEITPGIVSGFMLSLTLSLDDYVITQYLKEPSFETLSTYIQKILAKHPMPPAVRALSTIIFLIAVVVVIINNINAKQEAKRLASKI